MTSNQRYRASQILGFVNTTLGKLPNQTEKAAHEMEACYVIQAAMFRELDQEVIQYCESKFNEWYNYKNQLTTT